VLDTKSFVSWLLYFTCMKNRITRNALPTAMPSATGKLRIPRSMNATPTVIAVSTISEVKIV
jgi:hypothetical protein